MNQNCSRNSPRLLEYIVFVEHRIIERKNRTLKTALKARGGDWIQGLPIILLSLRAIPNESRSSPFTTVTGTSLLPTVQKAKSTNVGYIKDLARMMKTVDFATLSVHGPHQSFIPKQLQTSSHVWLRIDRIRRALEARYFSTFKVKT